MTKKVNDMSTLETAQERVRDLIGLLGLSRADVLYGQLDAAVQTCMAALEEAVQDVPVYESAGASNRRSLIKVPSQKVTDIKAELEELLNWFTTGRRPSKRKVISDYALAAMLGEPPFGKYIIVAGIRRYEASSSFDAENSSNLAVEPEFDVHHYEILSGDPQIANAQMHRFRKLRGAGGEPLEVFMRPFDNPFPPFFVEAVDAARERSVPLFIDKFEEVLTSGPARDRKYLKAVRIATMRKPTLVVLGMLDNLFPVTEKSRITLTRWSQSDPIFAFIRSALDIVWPNSYGIPDVRRVSLAHAKGGLSQSELLQDLAQQLVAWVQELVDARKPNPAAAANNGIDAFLYARFGGDRSVIGTRDNQFKRVADTVSLVLSLRVEQAAYFVARWTSVAICQAVFSGTDDPKLRAAAETVSGRIVERIDRRKMARDRLLNFGYDRLEGDTLKWSGRFDVGKRFKWGGEARFFELVRYGVYSKHQLLEHFDDLVDDLFEHCRIDATTRDAWTLVRNWAMGPGQQHWEPAQIPDDPDVSLILRG